MVNVFLVRHKQPKDLPFQKSPSAQLFSDKKYYNVCKLTTLVFLICMSTLYYGLCLSMISAVSSVSLAHSYGQWAGETSTIGLLIGFFPIGGAIGALISKFFIKFFTRRQILIIVDIAAIITTGLLQIPNIGLLLALRIIQGILVGIFMACVPLYINQLVPIDLHGSEGVISQILIVVGVVIDYIFKVAFTASGANLELYWRFVFGFSGIPCIIQLFFLLSKYIPQSPMSLIQKGEMQKARDVLSLFNVPEILNDALAEMIHQSKKSQMKKIAKSQGINSENSKKYIQYAQDKNAGIDSSTQLAQETKIDNNTKQTLSLILEMYAKEKKIQPQVHRILSQHHIKAEPVPFVAEKIPKKALFLGFQLHFMQQFSGIKMVITQAGVLFTKYNSVLSLYSPLIANVAQLIATCISTCILSRFGRKNPTLLGNLSLSILNFIMAALFLANIITKDVGLIYGSFALIIIFEIVYALSVGPVVWPYVPEIMPVKYVPFASCMNWIAAAICTIATPYILDAVGSPYPVFFFFGGIMLGFFFINLNLLVETKGLTPTQIAAKLSK